MGQDVNYQPLFSQSQQPQEQQLSPLAPVQLSGFYPPEEEKLDLRKFWTVVRRRVLIIGVVAIAVSSGIIAKILAKTPIYESQLQLLVEPVSGEKQFDQLTTSLAQGLNSSANSLDYESQIQVLSSPQVMLPIIKKIQTEYPEIDYGTIQNKLLVSQLQQTKILEIRYQDSDPDKVKFVLEQIGQGYINYSRKEQQTTTRQGIEFVDEQLPKLQKRVNKLQEEVQRFRQKNNITDPETQAQLLTNRFSAVQQTQQETQTLLDETRELYTNLQNQLGLSPQEAINAAALSEAPRYQKLLDQLSEVEAKIANESARFTPDSPIIETLEEQRQNLEPLLNKEAAVVAPGEVVSSSNYKESLASPNSIRLDLTQKLLDAVNRIEVLEVRSSELAQIESKIKGQLQELAVISRQYTDLQRQLLVATESLNRFLAEKETLEIESAQKTLPWQMIRPSQLPENPISPNVPRGVVLGIFAGLLAGAGAGLLAEKLDRVFHSAEELKESSGLPLLGTIPFRKELKKGYTNTSASSMEALEVSPYKNRYVASPFTEAFRSLQANLHFLNPDQSVRSVVISSTVPAEGKSTITIFLAQAAAAMGQKVLLVDADLRRPQVHVRMDLPNVWGLSNVISSDIDYKDVIVRSPVEENLFVLTAGEIPPDPTRLLYSKKMQSLVEQFQESFDLVIFDTPPLLGLTDARLLAAHTDGMVMVVGIGKTDRSLLRQVLDGLRTSNAKVLGLVANGVKGYVANSSYYLNQYYTEQSVEMKGVGSREMGRWGR
ncbi:MAG: polysaccharide biosynthesis tyrosine autokinase [Coleofasciculaceae cyanobacterium]